MLQDKRALAWSLSHQGLASSCTHPLGSRPTISRVNQGNPMSTQKLPWSTCSRQYFDALGERGLGWSRGQRWGCWLKEGLFLPTEAGGLASPFLPLPSVNSEVLAEPTPAPPVGVLGGPLLHHRMAVNSESWSVE